MQVSKPKKGYKLVSNFFRKSFEIPEDWEYPKFHEVVKTNSLTKIDDDTVPYIPMDAVDVSKPHFNYFEERTLSENRSLAKFQENDVLFARITDALDPIWRRSSSASISRMYDRIACTHGQYGGAPPPS